MEEEEKTRMLCCQAPSPGRILLLKRGRVKDFFEGEGEGGKGRKREGGGRGEGKERGKG